MYHHHTHNHHHHHRRHHRIPCGTQWNAKLSFYALLLNCCVLWLFIFIWFFSFLTFVPCDQRVDQRFMQRKQLKPFISINNQQHLRNAQTIALPASSWVEYYRLCTLVYAWAYYWKLERCTRRLENSTVGFGFTNVGRQHVSFGY